MVTFVAVLFKPGTETTKAQLDGWSRTLSTSDEWFHKRHIARLTSCQCHHCWHAINIHKYTHNKVFSKMIMAGTRSENGLLLVALESFRE